MTQKALLKRNIWLVYVLTGLANAWFWIAIWVFYYLRFTDYAGIGLLESIMIATYVLGEIPTGAIADLLGKKRTLTVSFLIQAVGFAIMGLATAYPILASGVFIASLGGVLASGTFDALVYDSLISIKGEKRFDKVIGNIASIRMATLGAVSIAGGYLYTILPGLPFLVLSMCLLGAFVVSFFLVEPPIDSVVFSLKNYFKQTAQGFHQLVKTPQIKIHSIIIIGLTMIVSINGHVLIDTQLYDQGWSATELGYVATIMFFVAAILSQLTPFFVKLFGRFNATLVSALLIAVSMLSVPLLGVIAATGVILIRDGILQIFGNTANAAINAATDSKYRATTLSTYNMISSIPYLFLAYYIGTLMDLWTVNSVTVMIGIVLAVSIGMSLLFVHKKA
ncbi:MFS transporter [Candidatus Woesebacteria bacterium]|nr:MFS transporter [Candidatus Woesebacteria bacterium]